MLKHFWIWAVLAFSLGACREKNDQAVAEVREMAPSSVTAPKVDPQDDHNESADSAAAAENEGDTP